MLNQKRQSMKKIVFLLIWIMSFGVVQAQWTVYPEIGMTAVARGAGDDGYGIWQSGWKAGAGVEYQLAKLFSLKSGLYYTQRGYELEPYMHIVPREIGENEDLIQMSTGKTKRHFLQIPLLAQVNIPLADHLKLHIGIGPYVAYCLSSNNRYDLTTFMYKDGGYGGPNAGMIGNPGDYGFKGYHKGNDYGDYTPFSGIRKFAWGGIFEVGLDIKDWFIKAGYDITLGKEYRQSDIKANYHTLSLTAGYKFRL